MTLVALACVSFHFFIFLPPTCREFGTPEFLGHGLQTSMTRATVDDGTAGLGQSLRTGRCLVGGSSFHGVSGLCLSSLPHGLPAGSQAQGMRRRPMQAWVSCSESGTLVCDPHALGGDQCGEQRGPDLKQSTTTRGTFCAPQCTEGQKKGAKEGKGRARQPETSPSPRGARKGTSPAGKLDRLPFSLTRNEKARRGKSATTGTLLRVSIQREENAQTTRHVHSIINPIPDGCLQTQISKRIKGKGDEFNRKRRLTSCSDRKPSASNPSVIHTQ